MESELWGGGQVDRPELLRMIDDRGRGSIANRMFMPSEKSNCCF